MDLFAIVLRRDLHHAVDRLQPAEIRLREHPTPVPFGLRQHIEFSKTELAGREALVVTPKPEPSSPLTILYLHGGGYCLCSPGTHRVLVAKIALEVGAKAYALDYRLAPEHPHPAAVDDAVAACGALQSEGVEPRNLILAGDSAGGGLCLATLLRLRDEGAELPRAAILLSPWVDLALEGESIDGNAESDYLSRRILAWFAERYRNGLDAKTPSISPIHGDLNGLPPLFVQLGSDETLASEGRLLAGKAQQAGVQVQFQEWPGGLHVFQAFSPYVPEASEAIQEIRRFIRDPSAPRPIPRGRG